MSQRIIGLDLGSYSIKLVEVIRDFRTVQVLKAFEARIPLDPKIAPEEALATVLDEQFASENLAQKIVICAFPGHQASLRLITLPVTDRKQLEKVLPFEVENHIPVDLEDVQLDWDLLSTDSAGAHILAATVLKERFQKFLGLLNRVDIEPREVTLDALALAFLANPLRDTLPHVTALMDCGHSKTNLCILRAGEPIYARSMGVAGREMTRALEQDFKLSFLEAETLKQTDGALVIRSGPGVGGEAERISKSLRRVVDDLAAETRQTFFNCEELCGATVDEVYLFGGSAKLRNLAPYLSSALEIPCKRLNALTNLGVQDFSDEQAYSLQTALALAIRGAENQPRKRINFRKGQFRGSQSFQSASGAIREMGRLAAILIAVLIVFFATKSFLLSSKNRSLEKEIQGEILHVLPDFKFRGTRQAISTLQERLAGGGAGSDAYSKIAAGKSPLLLLKDLSDAVPTDAPMTLTDLNIDTNLIRLEGSTNSRESSSKIREALAKNPTFSKVSEDKIQKTPEGFVFTFSIALGGKGEN